MLLQQMADIVIEGFGLPLVIKYTWRSPVIQINCEDCKNGEEITENGKG